MTTSPGFYLAIGSVLTESVTTKITTAGNEYRAKLLSSTPENWWTIISYLQQPRLLGVIAKFTANDFQRFVSPKYAEVTKALLAEIAHHPYLVVIHEAVISDPTPEIAGVERDFEEEWDGVTWNDQAAREFFGTLDRQIRDDVRSLLDQFGLTVATYKRNMEASVLAASFVEDTQSNLLFRIYVPAGRLYEEELSKLLNMFHDWVASVKQQTVRQGGYKTPNGRVIEFYGEPGMTQDGVNAELQEFAQFLGLLDQPGAAEGMLRELGLDAERATELTAKYGKEARRVLLDTKHERDRRMLSIQQQLESELIDDLGSVSPGDLHDLVHRLVPTSPFAIVPAAHSALERPSAAPHVTVNQQFFQHVEGIVAQNVNGRVSLGTSADQLLALVREAAGGASRSSLESDVRELADPGAPTPARIGARQRLKEFLARNGKRVEAATFQLLWKWVENQIGPPVG